MSSLVLPAGVFVISVILTGLLRALALRIRILDVPVDRSAHSAPTPVGGGAAIVLLSAASALYFYADGTLPHSIFMALLGAYVVAFLGFIDDLRSIHAKWRVPLHIAAAIWSVAWLGDVAPIDFGLVSINSQWILQPLAVVALVWLLNLYNFMDGIDGIAGSELVCVNLVSLFFVINSTDYSVTLIIMVLGAASAGFLAWNWEPARIFMGDVGSGFSGFMLGLLALITMQQGSMTVWSWLILLGVFVVDATITLLRRFLVGERWYDGHTSHAYQHAARHYKSHGKVTMTVVLINICWLTPWSVASVVFPKLGFFLSLLALGPLVMLALKFDAGKSGQFAMTD
jgi:Fuc2NAc and GlcNAc transferase